MAITNEISEIGTGPKDDSLYNTPDLSKQVKVRRRAVTSGDQAWRIFNALETANKTRGDNDAIIWNKYNGGQPFDPAALAASGQDNRYNFPTGFMSSIVDRVTPVPISIIDTARYLTSASIRQVNLETGAIDPSKARKTEILREKVTKAIRRWPEWKTFITGLCQSLVLIGRTFVFFLDPYTPWPKHFKTDQAFLPNGTGEHARGVQFITAKQDLLVHELVNFIIDRDSAKDAGWDVDASVRAVNNALPKQIKDDGSSSNNPISYEDAVREGNQGASYAGATTIKVVHILAVEPTDEPGSDNMVTHYILNREGNHDVLFQKEDRYDSIEDSITLFTLEPGNGKFYGSKGLGRKLINKHLAIERARNRLFDQLEMAGLVILQTDAARAPTAQFKVRHPFILLTSDATIQEQVIQANVKAYLDADAKMTDLAQQAVGQYLPNTLTNNMGEREKTAREVSVDYQREAEAKVAFLSRFWGQFADLVSAMQRKLLDPDTADKDAKFLQKELEAEGITKEEQKEFANAPAAEVVQDLTQVQNQQIIMVAAKYGQNPQINQRELLIRDIAAMSSPSIAEALVLPEQGVDTVMIEAIRQQMMETETIMSGSPGLPVSPRDNHEAHLRVLIPDLAEALKKGSQLGIPPQDLGKLANGLAHAEGHVQQWLANKEDPAKVKPYQKALAGLDQQLKQIAMKSAQAQVEQEDQQAQEQQAQSAPQVPLEKILDLYKDFPNKIQRQIEQALGFTPPTPEEEQASLAREAVLKHPDLPDKIAEAESRVGLPPGVAPAPPVLPSVTAPIPREPSEI